MGEKKKGQQSNGVGNYQSDNKVEGDEEMLSNMNHQLKGIKQKVKRFKDLHDKIVERDQYLIQPKKLAPSTPGDVSKMAERPNFVEEMNSKEVLAALEFLQTTVSTLEEFNLNFQRYHQQTCSKMSKQTETNNQLQEETVKQKRIIDLKESDLVDTRLQLRLYKQKYEDVNEQNIRNNSLVEHLKEEVKQHKKTIDNMKSANNAYATIDKLNEKVDSLDIQIAEKDREIAEQNEIIESLRAEMDEMKQSAEEAVKPTAPTEATIIQNNDSSISPTAESSIEQQEDTLLHSMLIQQLQQQLAQCQLTVQQQNVSISKKDLFIRQLEEQNQISMGISSEMFEVLLEEEFVNNYRGVNIEATLRDVIRVVQIIDYFDLSKPDGLDIRNMFLSDQANLLNNGNNVLIANFSDFNAFDHFAIVIRGNSASTKIPEESVAFAVGYMRRLLEKSDGICFGSVSFKQLSEQFDELGCSSIYLNNKPIYPQNIQQQLPRLSIEMLTPQAITQVDIPLSMSQQNLETILSNQQEEQMQQTKDNVSVDNVMDGISLSIRKPPFDDEVIQSHAPSQQTSSSTVVQEKVVEQASTTSSVQPTASSAAPKPNFTESKQNKKQKQKQQRPKSPQQQSQQQLSQTQPVQQNRAPQQQNQTQQPHRQQNRNRNHSRVVRKYVEENSS